MCDYPCREVISLIVNPLFDEIFILGLVVNLLVLRYDYKIIGIINLNLVHTNSLSSS